MPVIQATSEVELGGGKFNARLDKVMETLSQPNTKKRLRVYGSSGRVLTSYP